MIRRMFQLDPRLAQCAAMVREGCKVADLGTDHGYLPIWLAKQGKVKKAIATDVNVKPLQKAAGNVRKYKVSLPGGYSDFGWTGGCLSARSGRYCYGLVWVEI